MIYTFLIINIGLLLLPFCFAIDRKLFHIGFIRSAIIPAFIVTIIFSEVAVFFANTKVWVYNPAYLIGVNYRQLPLEAYLFVFAFTFMGLASYNYLNARFPKNDLQKFSLAWSNLLLGIFVAILFFAHSKWFPVITVSVLFVLLLLIEYFNKIRFMYRFYRAFVVLLIPFYICFGIICNLPIITYNSSETIQLNLANIPLENHFYMMGMLLMGVYFVEYFKRSASK